MIKILIEDSLYKEKEGALYRAVLEIVEKPLFEEVLKLSKGNQLRASRILGMNRNTFHARVMRLGINPKLYK